MLTTVLIVHPDPKVLNRAVHGLRDMRGLNIHTAADGNAAMDSLSRTVPDLVLSGVPMPTADGRDLFHQLRRRRDGIPVILITSREDDPMIPQMLRRVAAGLVSDTHIERDLPRLVSELLAVSGAQWRSMPLANFITRCEYEFRLDNDLDLAVPLVGYLQANLARMRLRDADGRIQVGVALMEAFTNAVHHGNLEISSSLRENNPTDYYSLADQRRREPPYSNRHVHVIVRETHDQAVYIIRDEGPGFKPAEIADPTDAANIMRSSGRGLLLIRTFVDEVKHNATGNEITMIVRRREPAQDQSDPPSGA